MARGRRQSARGGRRSSSHSGVASPSTALSFSKHSRRKRGCCGPMWLLVVGFLFGREWRDLHVGGQFLDGGAIAMACGPCECTGSSDGSGAVTVFENPSTGKTVALVDGQLSEMAEASCGKSVIAVGSTVFELVGVDFGPRMLAEVDMAPQDCRTPPVGALADAKCYSGDIFRTLRARVELDITICLCIQRDDGSSHYNVNINASATGASVISFPDSGVLICTDHGYTSQLINAVVDNSSYFFNFDLVVPGEGSSRDLAVARGPSYEAQSFICGSNTNLTKTVETPAPSVASVNTPPVAVPTAAPTPIETLAPFTEAELEQAACVWPQENPCTPTTPVANITKGLGSYYDPHCSGIGCGVGYTGWCRTCFFDTPLYMEVTGQARGDIPDYPDCPCCVLEVYNEPIAVGENGARCVNSTPSPTSEALRTGASGGDALRFEDKPLSFSGWDGFAFGALGAFCVMTFLPGFAT